MGGNFLGWSAHHVSNSYGFLPQINFHYLASYIATHTALWLISKTLILAIYQMVANKIIFDTNWHINGYNYVNAYV